LCFIFYKKSSEKLIRNATGEPQRMERREATPTENHHAPDYPRFGSGLMDYLASDASHQKWRADISKVITGSSPVFHELFGNRVRWLHSGSSDFTQLSCVAGATRYLVSNPRVQPVK